MLIFPMFYEEHNVRCLFESRSSILIDKIQYCKRIDTCNVEEYYMELRSKIIEVWFNSFKLKYLMNDSILNDDIWDIIQEYYDITTLFQYINNDYQFKQIQFQYIYIIAQWTHIYQIIFALYIYNYSINGFALVLHLILTIFQIVSLYYSYYLNIGNESKCTQLKHIKTSLQWNKNSVSNVQFNDQNINELGILFISLAFNIPISRLYLQYTKIYESPSNMTILLSIIHPDFQYRFHINIFQHHSIPYIYFIISQNYSDNIITIHCIIFDT